ncbi:MAG: DUF5688 family protein [Bacillus sp. (in: Bacteria)]|nr:DUF5688 family protein [Bacillus sp. (in: firmicutes)]MCM1426449.1 DUF5688 family protein [Eubacterium sp.]
MDYEKFKKELTKKLQEHYGKKAQTGIYTVKKNNGCSYDGVQITMEDAEKNVTPVISLDSLYEFYCKGSLAMQECVNAVCREREKYEATGSILKFAESVMDWNTVKDKVYPVLLSTQKNGELLKDLIFTPMLDLSIIYAIRMEITKESSGNVKVSRHLLKQYGIDEKQLHKQAMRNLAKDGYHFQDMQSLIRDMLHTEENADDKAGCGREKTEENTAQAEMYVLTNQGKAYGAAGILHKKLVREFAKGQSFFILPSSVHETIFVPVTNPSDKAVFDNMVEEVNAAQVRAEEQLSDHCYYYDGQTDEVKICA